MPPENFESPSQTLTTAQHAAINKIRELSLVIFGNHPEIAQDYRDGLTNREIAIKYNLDRDNNVGIQIAVGSVRLALKSLIPDREERRLLAQQHVVKSRQANIKHRKGIHGLSPQEVSANGKRGGASNVTNKTGFCRLPIEERIANLKRAKSQGLKGVPWDVFFESETGLREDEYSDQLFREPLIGSKKEKSIQIAQMLNEKFHGGKLVRTARGVFLRMWRLKATPGSRSTL